MKRVIAILFLALLLNSAYIAALPSATIFYMANVLLHVALGIVIAVWLGGTGLQPVRFYLIPAGIIGVYLAIAGATTLHRWALWAHIIFAIAGSIALIPYLGRRS